MEKYENIECKNQGFEKFISGENIFGTEFYVSSTSQNEVLWIIFTVLKIENIYRWAVTYLHDNNPNDEQYSDIFERDCSVVEFKINDF